MLCLLRMPGAAFLFFLVCPIVGAVNGPSQAFVFVGPTGDNALRENGVWQGLFEAFCGGVLERAGVAMILAAMNEPHTQDELKEKVLASLAPVFAGLRESGAWACGRSGGDCRPEALLELVSVDIQKDRDACAQAEHMAPRLVGFGTVTMYLSVPPSVFGDWVRCGLESWSDDNATLVHTAVEKPFGTGIQDAVDLHSTLQTSGLPDNRLHLVDHWLSFFMSRHLAAFRKIAESQLGMELSKRTIRQVVVKQYEVRGLEGRGSFFDGVGQTRDMVQSHLLQMLALVLMDPNIGHRADAKQAILDGTSLVDCCFGQYKDFLFEPKLGYHPNFADATWCDVLLHVDTDAWRGVPMHIMTGKSMGKLEYSITLHQRDGPGVLIFSIGKEEAGVASVSVTDWPLSDGGVFDAPAPGFDDSVLIEMKPAVVNGTGDIATYDEGLQSAYFPKPYAVMVAALLSRDYSSAFVTWPECYRSWEIVTASSPSVCLDPPPERVGVYRSPLDSGDPCLENSQTNESLCWLSGTVQDSYDGQFACSSANDAAYSSVDFYQAKCEPRPDTHADGHINLWIIVGVIAIVLVVASVIAFVFFLRRSRRDIDPEPSLDTSLQPRPGRG